MSACKMLRRLILVLAATYFVLPLAMTAIFSLWEGGTACGVSAYAAVFSHKALLQPLILSLELGVATIAAIYIILAPAVIAAHIYMPRMRGVIEFVAILPFVVPAIALVGGLSMLVTGPMWLIGSPFYLVIPYFFLALPFAFRALDVGLAALDIRTLKEAAESLGAGGLTTIRLVVVPGIGAAIVNCALLTFTVVIGEFTVANILLFPTFPVAINEVGKSSPTQAAALSMISFVLTWLAMLVMMAFGRKT
ncbi:ABC transporter permease [Rhizobium sp. B21/90]|uniref:ABC transporter permease n=1 Tax=Rhizobium sp. B21/90 TaxID=2819993 RepID=UPI001C5AC9FA|nr:hypothetical protein [Rhizobium sp. B21/90]QYA03751.1 hypothetical protein J5278_23430 [Rhizobium sp. B21/90]